MMTFIHTYCFICPLNATDKVSQPACAILLGHDGCSSLQLAVV